MVYDDPVDTTYVVPKFNKDADKDDADDKEELDTTLSYHNPAMLCLFDGKTTQPSWRPPLKETMMVTCKHITSMSQNIDISN